MTTGRVLVTQQTTDGVKAFLVDTVNLEPVGGHDERLDGLHAVILKADNTPGSDDACLPDPWSQVVWDLFYEVRLVLIADGRRLP